MEEGHTGCWIALAILIFIIYQVVKHSKKEPYVDPALKVFEAMRESASRPRQVKKEIPQNLKKYVTRLRKVYASYKSFASTETQEIGQEIYAEGGNQLMLDVHQIIREQLGPGPARELENKWGGIGEWMG